MRAAGMRRLGRFLFQSVDHPLRHEHFWHSRQDRILATEVAIENGVITDRFIRVPSGPGKPEAIRSVLQSTPDCAFGNAIWDREMLSMATRAFAINPNPNLRQIALANGWTVYQPEANSDP